MVSIVGFRNTVYIVFCVTYKTKNVFLKSVNGALNEYLAHDIALMMHVLISQLL